MTLEKERNQDEESLAVFARLEEAYQQFLLNKKEVEDEREEGR